MVCKAKEKNKKTMAFIKKYVLMVIGCVITAFAASTILKPNGLCTSGITGLSILLEKVVGINYSYIYYIITFIIIIITLFTLGKKEVMNIIILSVLYPTTLLILEKFKIEFVSDDMFLVVVCFSVLYGLGVGIILRLNFSFGGTDTLSKIIQKNFVPFLNINMVMLILDGIVLILSAFIFGLKVALYGIISQLIFTKVVDYVMFAVGTKLYKHQIISEKYYEISQFIMKDLGRGVTLSQVTGAYTNKNKMQVLCVCSPKESVKIKNFISKIDKNAYVEVLPVVSVWGIGLRFKRIDEA